MPCCAEREDQYSIPGINKMSRALSKTKLLPHECTTACGRNLQTERALHRTTQSGNRGGKADTTVSGNPSGHHHPANTRLRIRYEQRVRA